MTNQNQDRRPLTTPAPRPSANPPTAAATRSEMIHQPSHQTAPAGTTRATDRAAARASGGAETNGSTNGSVAPLPPPIMATKEHKRFIEFADAIRKSRFVGLCFGAPGVGKTRSVRDYSNWDQLART